MSKYIGTLIKSIPDLSDEEDHPAILYKSLVGVEIELEGVSYTEAQDRAGPYVNCYWDWQSDGSLRGRNFEAVLNQPLCGAELQKAVYNLACYLNTYWGMCLDANYRTSMHVHLDVRDLTPEQLGKLILIYTLFEKVLLHYLGEDRSNNNFCIPLHKTLDSLASISYLFEGNIMGASLLARAQDKYSALNLNPITTFGSIEFRGHKGTYNYEEIISWINILLLMKKWSVHSAPEPGDMPQWMSAIGPPGICREVFGEYGDRLICPDFSRMCYCGIRRVQDLVFNKRAQNRSKGIMKNKGESGTPFNKFKQRAGV